MPSVEDKQLLYLPLERAWRIAKNSQDLVPRLMPQVFSSIDLVQGDGSIGSVYEITMGPGVPGRRGKKVKERVDMLDDDTHTLTHTTLEGGDPRYSSFSSSINYEPGPYPDSTIRTATRWRQGRMQRLRKRCSNSLTRSQRLSIHTQPIIPITALTENHYGNLLRLSIASG